MARQNFDKKSFNIGLNKGQIEGFKDAWQNFSKLWAEYVEYLAQEKIVDSSELTKLSILFDNFTKWAEKKYGFIF